jgi:uncharacterized damage-inducible protein DinB
MTTLKETVQIDLRYSAWATGRLLEACAELSADERSRELGVSHGSIVNTLHHVYVSERFWIGCLMADHIPSLDEMMKIPAPAALPFHELVQAWPAQWAEIDRWLATATDEALSQTLPFDLSAGKRFDCPRWQIIRHFVNHATLHRGQIVGMIRALGKKPPCVDYIEYHLRSRNLL